MRIEARRSSKSHGPSAKSRFSEEHGRGAGPGRREFLAATLFAATALGTRLEAGRRGGAPRAGVLRLLAIFDPGRDPAGAAQGLRFGAEEAGRMAMLLGTTLAVHVTNRTPPRPEPEDADAKANRGSVAWDAVLAAAGSAFDEAPGPWPAAPRICFGPDPGRRDARVSYVRAETSARVEAAAIALTERQGRKSWTLVFDRAVDPATRSRALEAIARIAARVDGECTLDDPREAAAAVGTSGAVAAVGTDRFVLAARAALHVTETAPLLFTGTLADPTDDTRGRTWLREAYAVEWSPHLQRYGAGELNERFERVSRAPMGPSAWAAWFAVRAATDALLRARATGGTVADLLTTGRFDGHKGVPLVFDQETGRLHQPLYILSRTAPGPFELREP